MYCEWCGSATTGEITYCAACWDSRDDNDEIARMKKSLGRERDDLRNALLRLMSSADCRWEERNLGHDWRDAMEHAREALGIHPGGL